MLSGTLLKAAHSFYEPVYEAILSTSYVIACLTRDGSIHDETHVSDITSSSGISYATCPTQYVGEGLYQQCSVQDNSQRITGAEMRAKPMFCSRWRYRLAQCRAQRRIVACPSSDGEYRCSKKLQRNAGSCQLGRLALPDSDDERRFADGLRVCLQSASQSYDLSYSVLTHDRTQPTCISSPDTLRQIQLLDLCLHIVIFNPL